MVDRIAALKIPVTFICEYAKVLLTLRDANWPSTDGDSDWMDPEGGTASVENLRQAGNGHGRMYIVPHAGHHCECCTS